MNLKQIFNNTKGLIKLILKSKSVSWQSISSRSRNCSIDPHAKIHPLHNLLEVSVGKGTYISSNATISYTTIGKFCSIGPNFISGWGIHPLTGISTSPAFYSTKGQSALTFSPKDKIQERKSIAIGNDVFIGANVTVLDGISIGDGAVIGAGAVVSKDIPPYAVAIGTPISVHKYRFNEDIIQGLLNSKWWDGDDEALKSVEKYFNNPHEFLQIVNKEDKTTGQL